MRAMVCKSLAITGAMGELNYSLKLCESLTPDLGVFSL
jgi:hypothetical protein